MNWIKSGHPESGRKVLLRVRIPYTDDSGKIREYETVLTGIYFNEDGCYYEYSFTSDTYSKVMCDVT